MTCVRVRLRQARTDTGRSPRRSGPPSPTCAGTSTCCWPRATWSPAGGPHRGPAPVRGLGWQPPVSTRRSRASASSGSGTARSWRSGTTVTTLAWRSSWGYRSTRARRHKTIVPARQHEQVISRPGAGRSVWPHSAARGTACRPPARAGRAGPPARRVRPSRSVHAGPACLTGPWWRWCGLCARGRAGRGARCAAQRGQGGHRGNATCRVSWADAGVLRVGAGRREHQRCL
jgi:hypothetical protein